MQKAIGGSFLYEKISGSSVNCNDGNLDDRMQNRRQNKTGTDNKR